MCCGMLFEGGDSSSAFSAMDFEFADGFSGSSHVRFRIASTICVYRNHIHIA